MLEQQRAVSAYRHEDHGMIRETRLPWLAQCLPMLGLPMLGLLMLGLLVICTGCPSRDINTIYGRRRGTARTSLNGTSVLSDMFRQAGHKVTTWGRLSPRLERSQVIVWTPNSFELPTQKEIDYLENWLTNDQGRTLVYVARDYDAAIEYW